MRQRIVDLTILIGEWLLDRLDRLVANLLDLSRLEAGVAPAHRELWPVDGNGQLNMGTRRLDLQNLLAEPAT